LCAGEIEPLHETPTRAAPPVIVRGALSIAITEVFPCSGRRLQGSADQFGVRLLVSSPYIRPKFGDRSPALRRDLSQPDHRLDRFDLAEERANVLELVMPPMLKDASGLGGYLPLIRVAQVALFFDIAPDLVDDRGRVVFLSSVDSPCPLSNTKPG
jgi:hypothetical protein